MAQGSAAVNLPDSGGDRETGEVVPSSSGVPEPEHVVPVAGHRGRVWLATLNHYTGDDLERLRSLGRAIGDPAGVAGSGELEYLTFVKEVGTLKKVPHLHLWMAFSEPKRISYLQKHFGGNRLGGCTLPRGTPAQIMAYYSKENKPEVFGVCHQPDDLAYNGKKGGQILGGQKEKERWAAQRELLASGAPLEELDPQIMICHWNSVKSIRKHYLDKKPLEHFEGVRGVWVYGDPGLGKSTWAREAAVLDAGSDESRVFFKDMTTHWWDGYDDQAVVIGEDFDKFHRSLGGLMKIWLDKFGFSAQNKGGAVRTSYLRFYITSNYSIEDCWDDEATRRAIRRRCRVVHYVRDLTHPGPEPWGKVCESVTCECRVGRPVKEIPIKWHDVDPAFQ
jgi:hypothetical protein